MFHAILGINLSENKEKREFFRTTLGAKCILKEMAKGPQDGTKERTDQEGYGVLRPFNKVFETDQKFIDAVNKAYDNRDIL